MDVIFVMLVADKFISMPAYYPAVIPDLSIIDDLSETTSTQTLVVWAAIHGICGGQIFASRGRKMELKLLAQSSG